MKIPGMGADACITSFLIYWLQNIEKLLGESCIAIFARLLLIPTLIILHLYSWINAKEPVVELYVVLLYVGSHIIFLCIGDTLWERQFASNHR